MVRVGRWGVVRAKARGASVLAAEAHFREGDELLGRCSQLTAHFRGTAWAWELGEYRFSLLQAGKSGLSGTTFPATSCHSYVNEATLSPQSPAKVPQGQGSAPDLVIAFHPSSLDPTLPPAGPLDGHLGLVIVLSFLPVAWS